MKTHTESARSEPARQRSPWWVVIGSGMAQCVGIGPLVLSTFGQFVLPIASETGWSRATITVAFTVATVGFAIGTHIVGYLLDRFALRLIVVPSWILYCLSIALIYVTPHSLPLFYLPYLTAGLFAGGTFVPFSKAVLSWFDSRRGAAISVLAALGALGAASTPALAGALTRNLGWRAAYPWMALIALIVSLTMVFAFVQVRGERSVRGRLLRETVEDGRLVHLEPPGLTLRESLSGRHFWMILGPLCLTGVVVVGIQVNVVPMMTDLGMDPTQAALLLTVYAAASLTGRVAGGFLLDRLHAPVIAAVALLCPVVGLFFLHPPFASAATAMALVGVAFGMEIDLLAFLVSRYLGMRRIGALLGTVQSAVQLSTAFGPLLVGLGYTATGSYTGVLPYLGATLLLCSGTMLFLGPYSYPAVPGFDQAKPATDDAHAETTTARDNA